MALDSLDPLTAPMPAPPVRQFSFTDFQTNNPTAPPPGDRLDAEFDRANNAIEGTIAWANVSLNTDGTLRDAIVGESNLQPDLFDDIASDAIAQVQHLVNQAALCWSAAGRVQTQPASATTASTQAVITSGRGQRGQVMQVNASFGGGIRVPQTPLCRRASGRGDSDNDARGAAALAQDMPRCDAAWPSTCPTRSRRTSSR
jgi:hypothetical protein